MIILYTDSQQVRGQLERSLHTLFHWIEQKGLDRWAIYLDSVNGERFHNSTDPRFLVDHCDPYWESVLDCRHCDDPDHCPAINCRR